MNKVIMVVSDALRDDTAASQMGYLEHLVEAKLATRYTVIAELPTMSRPLYETLHTGVPVTEHGVTNNRVVRRSTMPNVFEHALQHGRTTGAAAYYWFSELYVRAPYDYIADREQDDPQAAIQHGRYYTEDATPDREVFASGGAIVSRFEPDYVLIHPMGMDYLGETYGSDSPQYRNNAIFQDMVLADLIPRWLELGYLVLVTADHGINNDRLHGGTTPDVRHVPLYLIRRGEAGRGNTGEQISQLRIAPTLCRLLAIPIPETMKQPPID
ncbi:MAG TPA: alkaline phosphatase family protein [Anaerolineales bacterium]|nr:alkaline phosphatase family protein [Anaerolineales bacterium]